MKANSIIIDVREPKEFSDNHLPGAVNIPSSSFTIEDYSPYKDTLICLICRTGNRANIVKEKLESSGFDNVSILDKQMTDFENLHSKEASGWTVDRQFRMTLSVFLIIFLLGYFLNVKWLITLPIIIASGLLFSAITDRCYLRIGISMLPWSRKKGAL